MNNLQERGLAFLNRPIPPELAERYAPGSLTDMMIAAYVQDGALDAEAMQLLEICVMEADGVADRYQTPEAKAHFEESAAIVHAIQDVLSAR